MRILNTASTYILILSLVLSRIHSLDRAQAQLDELYDKQGRISRFKTRAERDTYLNKEIAAIELYETSQAEQSASLRREYDGTMGRIEEYAQKAREIDQTLEERKDTLTALTTEISDLNKSQGELTERRKCVCFFILFYLAYSDLAAAPERCGARKPDYNSSEIMLRNRFATPNELLLVPWTRYYWRRIYSEVALITSL